jgi:hypothetical protein
MNGARASVTLLMVCNSPAALDPSPQPGSPEDAVLTQAVQTRYHSTLCRVYQILQVQAACTQASPDFAALVRCRYCRSGCCASRSVCRALLASKDSACPTVATLQKFHRKQPSGRVLATIAERADTSYIQRPHSARADADDAAVTPREAQVAAAAHAQAAAASAASSRCLKRRCFLCQWAYTPLPFTPTTPAAARTSEDPRSARQHAHGAPKVW